MTIELRLDRTARIAQTLRIRTHALVSDTREAEGGGVYRLSTKLKIHGNLTDAQLQELQAVAQECPVHQLMSAVPSEITTGVERLS